MIEALRLGALLPLNLLLRRWPVSLVHFVTDSCNASCAHCFLSVAQRRTGGRDLTLSEIERLTRRVGPCLLNVNLTGGEPFRRHDLTTIAELYLANAGVRSLFVTTNGSLPTRVLAFAETFRRQPRCVVTFSLSLDDLPAQHDLQRGMSGLAERVLSTYNALVALGGNIQAVINFTIFEENAGRALDVYRHLRDGCGIRQLTFGPARDQGVYRAAPDARRRIDAAYRAVLAEFQLDQASGRMDADAARTPAGRILNRKNAIVHQLLDQELMNGRRPFPCTAGRLFGVIAADGSVYACEPLHDSLGNLREVNGDLMALWRGPRAKATVRTVARCTRVCTYECAWTLNVLSRPRYWPKLAGGAVGPMGGRGAPAVAGSERGDGRHA